MNLVSWRRLFGLTHSRCTELEDKSGSTDAPKQLLDGQVLGFCFRISGSSVSRLRRQLPYVNKWNNVARTFNAELIRVYTHDTSAEYCWYSLPITDLRCN